MSEKTKTKKLVINMDAGKSLRILMTKHEVSREQIAEHLGVSLVTASALRRNQYMQGKHLAELSAFFGITPSDFLRLGESEE